MNLTECEIRSVLFGPYGRVEEWNLTVVCFQPLKYYYSETIDQVVRSSDTQFIRAEFLAAFDRIRA
jgi:hypothetical protein